MSALQEQAIYSPVRSLTAFEETFRRLEMAIKLGLLPPGARLPAERELCARLGISRSTLRQALSALTEAGHVHATRGRGGGTFVIESPPAQPHPTDNDLKSWRDLHDQRVTIELGVASLAATRASPGSLDMLQQMLERLEATDDLTAYLQGDRRLHIELAVMTGNCAVVVAAAQIQSSLCDLLGAIEEDRTAIDESNRQHREILAALRAGDERATAAAMQDHLDSTCALLARAANPSVVS